MFGTHTRVDHAWRNTPVMHEIVQRPIFTGICLVLGGQEFNFHEQSKAICWQLLLLDISTQTPKAVIHYAVSVHNTNIVQLGMYFKGLLMYKSCFTHIWRRDVQELSWNIRVNIIQDLSYTFIRKYWRWCF